MLPIVERAKCGIVWVKSTFKDQIPTGVKPWCCRCEVTAGEVGLVWSLRILRRFEATSRNGGASCLAADYMIAHRHDGSLGTKSFLNLHHTLHCGRCHGDDSQPLGLLSRIVPYLPVHTCCLFQVPL